MEHLRYLNFTVMFKFPTRMPEKPQTPRKGVFLMRHKDFVYEKVSLRHTAECSAPSSDTDGKSKVVYRKWPCNWQFPIYQVTEENKKMYIYIYIHSLSQWLTFKLLGIPCLVGQIKFKLLFHGPLAEEVRDPSNHRSLSKSLVKLGAACNATCPLRKFFGSGGKRKCKTSGLT